MRFEAEMGDAAAVGFLAGSGHLFQVGPEGAKPLGESFGAKLVSQVPVHLDKVRHKLGCSTGESVGNPEVCQQRGGNAIVSRQKLALSASAL